MLVDLVALAGAALVSLGLLAVWPPLAAVFLGSALLALALYAEVSRVDRRPPPG